jgi:hypothetical protein
MGIHHQPLDAHPLSSLYEVHLAWPRRIVSAFRGVLLKHLGECLFEGRQLLHLFLYLGHPLLQEGLCVPTGTHASVPGLQQLPYVLELEAHSLGSLDEPQPLKGILVKEPVASLSPLRGRQETDLLVVPQCVRGDPCLPSQLGDGHAVHGGRVDSGADSKVKRSSGIQLLGQLLDPLGDDIPDPSHLLHRQSLGISEVSIHILLARDVGTGISAAHGDDHISLLGNPCGQQLGLLVTEVQAKLPHGLHHFWTDLLSDEHRLSHSRIRQSHQLLGLMMRCAVEEGCVHHSPVGKLRLKKDARQLSRMMAATLEEVAAPAEGSVYLSPYRSYLYFTLNVSLEDVLASPEERPVPQVAEQLEAALLKKKLAVPSSSSKEGQPSHGAGHEGGDESSLSSKAQETGSSEPAQTPLEPAQAGRDRA